MTATGTELVAAARRYLGAPYHHCGRNEHGLDCLGLLMVVAHDLGLTDWDIVNYSDQVDTALMRRGIERFCEEITLDEMEPGDVLLFAIKGSPQHLGFATDVGMIHAHSTVGCVVEHSLDRTWLRRLRAVFRWRGEEWQQ